MDYLSSFNIFKKKKDIIFSQEDDLLTILYKGKKYRYKIVVVVKNGPDFSVNLDKIVQKADQSGKTTFEIDISRLGQKKKVNLSNERANIIMSKFRESIDNPKINRPPSKIVCPAIDGTNQQEFELEFVD